MYYFSWLVPEKGFYWSAEAQSAEDIGLPYTSSGFRHMRPYLIPTAESQFRYSYPLEENPELFSVFAKLDGTMDSILKFANKHGHLGAPVGVGLEETKDGIKTNPLDLFGEGINYWQHEIEDMKLVYEIWHYINQGWNTRLGSRIHWTEDKVMISSEDIYDFDKYRKKKEFPWELFWTLARDDEETFYSFKKGDSKAPALYFLQKNINKKLKIGISPRILRDRSWRLHPYIMPSTLISALWLQFYLAVTGQKHFIQCEICGDLIEVTDKNRKSKKAHDTCRKRIWAQKNTVLKNWKVGKTVEEINALTSIDKEKIIEWVSQKENGVKI